MVKKSRAVDSRKAHKALSELEAYLGPRDSTGHFAALNRQIHNLSIVKCWIRKLERQMEGSNG